MIQTAAVRLAGEQTGFDADYLFDNFEDCCEIEFASLPATAKQPTVVKNLLSLFDQAAQRTEDRGRELKSSGKSRSKEKKQPARLSNEPKKKKRDQSLNHDTMKKKLRLNLQDVFGPDSRLLKKPLVQDSAKSGTVPGTTKNLKADFVRAKTDAISSSHLHADLQTKTQTSLGRLKTASGKQLPKSSSLRLAGIFNNKDLQTIKRIVGKNASKPSLGHNEVNPPTGSTRLHQTSSRHGSNKRSCSFFETDDKSRHQHSFRNLRGDSLMVSGNINSILSSSKNYHYKLLKKKETRRKQSALKDPDPLTSAHIRRGPSLGKSLAKEPQPKKPDACLPGKKPAEAPGKYYIPAHLGTKDFKPAKHPSFAHSEDFSSLTRNTYLHNILFPKMLTKAPPEDPLKRSRSKKPK